MGMLHETALTQKVGWCRVGRQAMTNEPSIIIIRLPFCGSRAGQVQDCQWVEFGFASGLLGSCSVQRWRFAESRVVGGDGLMTRAGNQPRSLYMA